MRDKKEIIQKILKNETYLPTSGLYKLAAGGLEKLSARQLGAIEIILDCNNADQRRLAELVDGLNPNCPEIGPGMMAGMKELAGRIMDRRSWRP